MRVAISLLFIFMFAYSFGQTSFDTGFRNGYKKGYCYQEFGCITPIPPITPIPAIGENYSSYEDGYSAGFLQGIIDGKLKADSGLRSKYGSIVNQHEREVKSRTTYTYTNQLPLGTIQQGLQYRQAKYDQNIKALTDKVNRIHCLLISYAELHQVSQAKMTYAQSFMEKYIPAIDWSLDSNYSPYMNWLKQIEAEILSWFK